MTAFNVAGLLREPPGSVRAYRLRDRYISLGSDVELAGPVDGDLRLQRTNRGILVRGGLDAPVRRTCARCLEAFVEPVHVTVSEEYLPSIDPESGRALPEPPPDEPVLLIDPHHEIDLTGVLRDEFALSEPMHPLCRPDCPGLCVECGQRLDHRHAAHETVELDPRLAGLARLLDRDPD
ncbi:MAG: YceD family protein [Candidatus Limnocylindria bacterium]